jgi:lauroyl/myristoyl acyltransferase
MKKGAAAVNFEYFALRAACALVNAMPYRMAAAVARFAARSAARVFGYRRKRTLERIESVFPGSAARRLSASRRRALKTWRSRRSR